MIRIAYFNQRNYTRIASKQRTLSITLLVPFVAILAVAQVPAQESLSTQWEELTGGDFVAAIA